MFIFAGVKQKHLDLPVISPIEVSLTKDFLDIGGQENASVDLNLTECGDTKGCYREPNRCKVPPHHFEPLNKKTQVIGP